MISRFLKVIGLGCVVAASLPFGAKASDFFTGSVDGIDLGAAGDTYHWAIFSLGGNVSISDITYNPSFADVLGNIGQAGKSTVSVVKGRVQGDVWVHTGGSVGVSGGAITGSILQGSTYDTVLNHGVSDATSASLFANSLAATPGSLSTIHLSNSSLSISAGSIANYVMHITDFVLSSSTLTLSGTASQHFIIDVTGNFSLSGASQVLLSGGLTPQDVLFNIVGSSPSSIGLSGGSSLKGIVLAPNRMVTLSGGSSDLGEVIAQKITLSGSSQVHNPLVSP